MSGERGSSLPWKRRRISATVQKSVAEATFTTRTPRVVIGHELEVLGDRRLVGLRSPEDVLCQIAQGGLVGNDDVAVDIGFRTPGERENALAARHLLFDRHLQSVVRRCS